MHPWGDQFIYTEPDYSRDGGPQGPGDPVPRNPGHFFPNGQLPQVAAPPPPAPVYQPPPPPAPTFTPQPRQQVGMLNGGYGNQLQNMLRMFAPMLNQGMFGLSGQMPPQPTHAQPPAQPGTFASRYAR